MNETILLDSEPPDSEREAMDQYVRRQRSCPHIQQETIITLVGSGWRCLRCGYTEAY